jgi:hypothetical protein
LTFSDFHLRAVGQKQAAIVSDELHLLLWPAGHVLPANHQQRCIVVSFSTCSLQSLTLLRKSEFLMDVIEVKQMKQCGDRCIVDGQRLLVYEIHVGLGDVKPAFSATEPDDDSINVRHIHGSLVTDQLAPNR